MSPSTSAPAGALPVPSTTPSEVAAAAVEAPAQAKGRLGLLLGVLLVAAVGAGFVYLPMLGIDLPSPGGLAGAAGLPTATLLAVPAGLAGLMLLVLVRRSGAGAGAGAAPSRRRRATSRRRARSLPRPRPRRSRTAAQGVSPRHTEADAAPDDLVPTMDPRALLLYARSLEGTLNDQEDRLEQVRRAADDRRQADLQQEHVRTRATVELMRRVHAHQPGVVALGRTEAAVARLGVEPGFTRPVLPSGPAGTMPVAFGAAPVQVQEPVPADTAAEPATAPLDRRDGDAPTRPLPGHGSLADREAALTVPSAPVPVELTAAGRPKVRPVPPPPASAPTRRGRRRARGAQG